MRITKTRLMRDKTINPNPPICKNKDPSITYIEIHNCETDTIIKIIERRGITIEDATLLANGGAGTWTRGYFYEPEFGTFHELGERHCLGSCWTILYNWQPIGQSIDYMTAIYDPNTNRSNIRQGFIPIYADPPQPFFTTLYVKSKMILSSTEIYMFYTLHRDGEDEEFVLQNTMATIGKPPPPTETYFWIQTFELEDIPDYPG